MMHKSRMNPWQRKLNVEALEDRTVLNGVVTANLNSLGLLQIAGDKADNQFTLAPSPIPGMLRVSGDLGTSTSINGAAFADFSLAGVKDITLRLEEGVDRVTLADFSITGEVTIIYGNDTDFVYASNFNARAAELIFAGGVGVTGANRNSGLLPGLNNTFDLRSTSTAPGLLPRVTGPGAGLGSNNTNLFPPAPGSGVTGSNNNGGFLLGPPRR